MTKLIKILLFFFLIIFFIKQNAFSLYDCINNCEAQYQQAAYRCIKKYKTKNCCSHTYVINDCLENDPNIDQIRECLEECDEKRSQCLNCCAYNPALDPCFSYFR